MPRLKLETLLAGLWPAAPDHWRNLTLVPLCWDAGAAAPLDYLLASEALERGKLRLTEVGQQGVVGELLAVSSAELPILLIDGEELVGAKQNRILNTDVLLRPHGSARIPVSCVERGRWHAERADFAPGGHAPPALRSDKSRAVSCSLCETHLAQADQSEVWEDVAEMLAGLGAASSSDAMSAAFEQRQVDLAAALDHLPYRDDAAGVIAQLEGRFAALDLFDRPATLAAIWSRLVSGYAADALAGRRAGTPRPGSDDPRTLLSELAATNCAAFAGVDLGQDWRFDRPAFCGSALVFKGRALHLSAFPGSSGPGAGRKGIRPIGRPTDRRRRWRQ